MKSIYLLILTMILIGCDGQSQGALPIRHEGSVLLGAEVFNYLYFSYVEDEGDEGFSPLVVYPRSFNRPNLVAGYDGSFALYGDNAEKSVTLPSKAAVVLISVDLRFDLLNSDWIAEVREMGSIDGFVVAALTNWDEAKSGK